jgi:hypothetical protein
MSLLSSYFPLPSLITKATENGAMQNVSPGFIPKMEIVLTPRVLQETV